MACLYALHVQSRSMNVWWASNKPQAKLDDFYDYNLTLKLNQPKIFGHWFCFLLILLLLLFRLVEEIIHLTFSSCRSNIKRPKKHLTFKW